MKAINQTDNQKKKKKDGMGQGWGVGTKEAVSPEGQIVGIRAKDRGHLKNTEGLRP